MYHTDLTEEKEQVADIARVGDELESIIENYDHGVLVTNDKGIISSANRAVCELFRYSESHLKVSVVSSFFS